jgi:methyl-accepting chemotaxis protein
MLGDMRISLKHVMMVFLSLLGIVAVASVGLCALRSNLLEDRKAKLQKLVLLAGHVFSLAKCILRTHGEKLWFAR